MVIGLLIGLVLGAIGVWLAVRSRIADLSGTIARLSANADRLLEAEKELASAQASREHEQKAFEEKLTLLEDAKQELANLFKAQSAEALRSNNSSFLQMAEQVVKPLKESLEKVDGQFRVLDQARGALVQQLRTLADGQDTLRRETGNLATALRAPHVRGRWGEVQLKRVVEATGMIEHCDFVLQATTRDGDGALLRPDLIVRLPGNKQVVVDAKVPLSAYLDACEAQDEVTRAAAFKEHARQVRDHVGKLAAKAYWRQFEPCPDFVVMFLPDESFLRAAQEHDSTIGEYAWGSNVIPASPTNLFAILRTVAAIWQQETVAESAREVHALGVELYERVGVLGGHFQRLGNSLTSAVTNYNKTLASLESRVIVSARKMEEYGIDPDLPELSPVEAQPRPLTQPELVDGADTDSRRAQARIDGAPRALDAA